MAEELFIPKLGQTVDQVTLINWLVQDGDKIKQGQEVLEVETDKAVFSVEAVDDGYIHIGPFKAGEVLPVLTVVALIGEKDESFVAPTSTSAESQAQASVEAATTENQKARSVPEKSIGTGQGQAGSKVFISPRARKLAQEHHLDFSAITPTGGEGARIQEKDVRAILSQEVKASPLARRLAEEKGIELRAMKGSGARGEITKADVEAALSAVSVTSVAPIAPALVQPAPLNMPDMKVSQAMPMAGARRVIAQRMSYSAQTSARVTLFMEADATRLVSLREKLKAQYQQAWGFAPGYNDLLAKVCALALRRFPYMNARINANQIEQLADVNIGIAVDADAGLLVPVIRTVDQKDLCTVGREFRQRVEEVRSGKISPDDLGGGTFTITNLGVFDVDGFTPVINLPEAAILGVGRIAPQAVVVEDKVEIRKMMMLSMAFDHRLTDGAPAARFLQYIKQLIEDPSETALTK